MVSPEGSITLQGGEGGDDEDGVILSEEQDFLCAYKWSDMHIPAPACQDPLPLQVDVDDEPIIVDVQASSRLMFLSGYGYVHIQYLSVNPVMQVAATHHGMKVEPKARYACLNDLIIKWFFS